MAPTLAGAACLSLSYPGTPLRTATPIPVSGNNRGCGMDNDEEEAAALRTGDSLTIFAERSHAWHSRGEQLLRFGFENKIAA